MTKKKINNDNLTILDKSNRKDNWTNIYTKEGVKGKDRQTGYTFSRNTSMREQDLKGMYEEDGFGKKIVNRPTDDMTRAWFEVTGDTDGDVNGVLQDICAPSVVRDALRWAKVFGGSLIVMGINDGGTLEDEVIEDNIKSIDFLTTYDRFRVTWENADLFEDDTDSRFDTPEWYTITPTNGSSFKVHSSRVLRFDGELTPNETKQQNDGWDDSIYKGIRTQLINLNSAYQSTKSVIDEYVITLIKIDNLQGMIASGNSQLVKDRMNILDLGRHTINSMILDSKEDYERMSSSVAGLGDILQEFQIALGAVSDMPIVILMGRSPGGMSSTGDADIRLYYDSIASEQNATMRKQMLILSRYVMLSKEGPFKGIELEDWTIEFNPLWQPTEKEAAETRKIQADTDAIYLQWNVLGDNEIRQSRFGGDTYSADTLLLSDELEKPEMGMLPGLGNPDDDGTGDEDKQPGLIKTDKADIFEMVSFGPSSISKEHTHEIFFF